MTDRFNLISQQLLQKDFSDCNIEELQLLSQQYPFFAPAQFLLVKKLKEENSPGYSQQFQKATLYHHNPLALDFLINDQEYDTAFPIELSTSPDAAFASSVDEMPDEQNETLLPVNLKDDQIPVLETRGFDIMDSEEAEKPEPVTNIEQVQPPTPSKHPKPENLSLSFEPYHTVDYFASVGVKLSKEEAAKDNFGRQLKSFTEWLKTMKKLPAAEQMKKLDPHAEEKVENIAAHSIDNAEVLTEAMAEVWVKQGKLEKAIEVYNKLSLLNPSKRAYFAAKLENLKKAI
jgi:hypothetical protein